ncbi:AAA family ATPase [Vibrio fluvialis]|nr:AAA family ATPase [Vibrio fluvialis]
MIVGLFIENYKCYKNSHYINMSKHGIKPMNVFIGDNGVGKSSILESIDCLMNGIDPKSWESTIGNKDKTRVAIIPLFLIKKSDFTVRGEILSKYETISDLFWSFDFKQLQSTRESNKLFIEALEDIKRNVKQEDYYLFSIGKTKNNEVTFNTSFHTKLFNKMKIKGVSNEVISSLLKDVLNHYSYIYFPVESIVNDKLNLRAREFENLIDENIRKEIKNILERRDLLSSDPSQNKAPAKGRQARSSVLNYINDRLSNYIEIINSRLEGYYTFQPIRGDKKNITANDVVDVIISEFFEIRHLTKGDKRLESLSSGQKRLALIDVVSTLLSTKNKTNKEVILAIDEPEISLDSYHRFEQYSRLITMSETYNRSLLITTHWYGLLMRPTKGNLIHISEAEPESEKTLKVNSYPLDNLYDYRRRFPDDFQMKSYFDLMSSMISILKKRDVKILLCEGSSDAKYLRLYIDREDLIIIPFNGCGNIKRLYSFLSVPFLDSSESSQIKGKVFCLIDTDTKKFEKIESYNESSFGKKLFFYRLGIKDKKVCINKVTTEDATKVTIEDGLSPLVFLGALNLLSEEFSEVKTFLSYVKDIDRDSTSLLNHDLACFVPSDGIGKIEFKVEVYKFIEFYESNSKFKDRLADAYVKYYNYGNVDEKPSWIKSVEEKLYPSLKLAAKRKKSANV